MAPNCSKILDLSIANKFDMDVGYSPTSEDLETIDTQYLPPTDVSELSTADLNIVHLNIRGLISKQEKLSCLLTTLGG